MGLLALGVTLLLLGCGPRAQLSPIALVGSLAANGALFADAQGHLYAIDAGLEPGDLLAVTTRDAPQRLLAVLMVVAPAASTPPELGTGMVAVVKVADVGPVSAPGEEVVTRLGEPLQASSGVSVVRLGLDSSTGADVPSIVEANGGVRAEWYWLLRTDPAPQAVGFRRFAAGLVRASGQALGEQQEGLAVAAWGRPGMSAEPVRVYAPDALDAEGWPALAASLGVELQRTDTAQRAAITVTEAGMTGCDARSVAVVADPAAFAVTLPGDTGALAQLSVLQAPWCVPVASASDLLAQVVVGMAALRNSSQPVAAYLLEAAIDAGATFAGSERAARLRLSELYALASYSELAREAIHAVARTTMELDAPAARSDLLRYRARILHMEMALRPTPERLADALDMYEAAIAAYEHMGFTPGAVDTLRQQADLLAAVGRGDQAQAARSRAAALVARAHDNPAALLELAVNALQRAPEQVCAEGQADDVAHWLAEALRGATALQDEELISRAAAWRVATAHALDETLDADFALALRGVDRDATALAEAKVELLSGRETQAMATWQELIMAEAAIEANRWIAASCMVALAESSTAHSASGPGMSERLYELIARLAKATETEGPRVSIVHAGCVAASEAPVSNVAPPPIEGYGACLEVFAAHLETDASGGDAALSLQRMARTQRYWYERGEHAWVVTVSPTLWAALARWGEAREAPPLEQRRAIYSAGSSWAAASARITSDELALEIALQTCQALEENGAVDALTRGARLRLGQRQRAAGQLDEAWQTFSALESAAREAAPALRVSLAMGKASIEDARGEHRAALQRVVDALDGLVQAEPGGRVRLILMAAQLRMRIAAEGRHEGMAKEPASEAR